MATNVIEIPANLVKNGDVVFHNNKEYPIVNTLRLSDVVQLQHSGGYFNFEWDRAVQILDKRPTTVSFAELGVTTRAVLACQVRPGNTLSYGVKFFKIKGVKDLGDVQEVRLVHETGYFDFSSNRIVHIVNTPPALETPTMAFNTQIKPMFLPYEEAVKPFSDEEDVKGADVEVGDIIWCKGNWATVTNVYKHPNSPYNKVNIDYDGVKGLQVRLTLTGTYSRKVRAVMETLNIQNAIEAQRILLQKLEQMLELTQLIPLEGDKVLIGGSSVRVDKASITKAARDEMKVAANKSAELIKKL